MATLLYRLGRFAYRRHWRVIIAWVLILGAIFAAGVSLGLGKFQDSFEIPGTASQEALDHLTDVNPAAAGASVQVVLKAPAGHEITEQAYRTAIADQVDALKDVAQVSQVIGPFDEFAKYAGTSVNDASTMALTRVTFDVSAEAVDDASIAELKKTASITEDAGLTTAFSGQVFQDTSFGFSITEVFGIVFAAVVLLITFGSLIAAGMPLLSSIVGVGISMGGILTFAGFVTVSSTAPTLAIMIGLAVGIDYALFIISRHRAQLGRGMDAHESAAIAVGTAGSAVVFAGLTVIIALCGLLVVGIPFLSVMGVGAAGAVFVAIAAATTLVPALLGIAGERLRPKPGSRAARRAEAAAAESDDGRAHSLGQRWVRLVMKAPVVPLVLVIGLLGVMSVPVASLDLNLPNNGAEPAGSTQRVAYDLIADGFGPGYNGPLIVEADITQDDDFQTDLPRLQKRLESLDDVADVSTAAPNATIDTAILQVIPASAPDAPETKQLVQTIRDMADELESDYGMPISVTGTTAIAIDVSDRLTNALLPFLLIVVGLSVLLLMAMFRSVLVPLKAALGFVLTIGASFGIVVAVFQWGWLAGPLGVEHTGPIISFLPIIIMAVLFGLAMDYEVFLVSGMREEYAHTGDAKRSVERGFANGARVVTAAALIMFFVFISFFPEGSGAIKPIALGLALGIAIDAFLVRMTLVPAIMSLLGRAAWWLPRWLRRVLPDVDIEGAALAEHRDATEWAAGVDAGVLADGLVVGATDLDGRLVGASVGPVSFAVPRGGMGIVSGPPLDRRLVAAAMSGRLEVASGRAHVLGRPLPSDASHVRGLVALGDLSGGEDPRTSVTIGELFTERVRLTRRFGSPRVSRVVRDEVLEASVVATQVGGRRLQPFDEHTVLAELHQLERAIVLSALALVERTPVVMLDAPDALAPDDLRILLDTLDALAGPRTTVVVGTPRPVASVRLRDAGPDGLGHRRVVVVADLTAPPAPAAPTPAPAPPTGPPSGGAPDPASPSALPNGGRA